MTAHQAESPGGRGKAFRLFPVCKLVRGGAYSAIYDLDRRRLYRFHDSYFGLFEMASSGDGILLDDIEQLEPAAKAKALEAIAFMTRHEIGHLLDDFSAAYMTDIGEGWSSPFAIVNAIVDVDTARHDWPALIESLTALQCDALQIRCFSGLVNPEELHAIMKIVAASSISKVEVIVRWRPEFDSLDWQELFARHTNLIAVQLHSAPRDEEFSAGCAASMTNRRVRFLAAPITGPTHCGGIMEGTLNTPSVDLYSELQSHNGCLNRKVSIRADGEICNCPSMKASFGKDLRRLREIVSSERFQRPWRINKDSMRVCRQCEFRYVCTDCRAYLDSDDSREKPARCNYDPTIGEWTGKKGRIGQRNPAEADLSPPGK